MDIIKERTGIEKNFFELCYSVVSKLSLEIYEMNYLPGSFCLRLFIRDPETDTAVLEDCIRVDRALTEYIDSEDWMPESLTLEVSSPGVFRELTQLSHFKSIEGQQVILVLNKKLNDDSLPRKVQGEKKVKVLLRKAEDDLIEVSIGDVNINLFYTDIKKANLEPDI